MQSILTRTQCAKDDEEEQELDCGGKLAMQYAESYTVAGSHLPCSVLSVILWRVPAMQSILNGQTHFDNTRNTAKERSNVDVDAN